jgi:uncharacterized protein YdaU (DUF1376 family)
MEIGMHFYQFNISDYRKDTVHLNKVEHYIYRFLIDWYYLDEKPIPLETQWVARRLQLGTQEQVDALQSVLNEFFERTEEGYKHVRIERDLAKYAALLERNRTNGSKGGRGRKATGNPLGSQSKPTGKATNNQETKKLTGEKRACALPPDFEPNEKGIKFAEEQRIDVAHEIRSFKDHHTAKGSTFIDWQAAWRTWVGHAVKYGRVKPVEVEPWKMRKGV